MNMVESKPFNPIRKTCFHAYARISSSSSSAIRTKKNPSNNLFFHDICLEERDKSILYEEDCKKCLVFTAVDRQLIFHRRTHKILYRFFISASLSPYCLLVSLQKMIRHKRRQKIVPNLSSDFPFCYGNVRMNFPIPLCS